MHILILGGTIFLGRALVEAALERGHEITLFNRGQTNPELFPHVENVENVEKLRGDRDGDLSALAGRQWDAVIDTCGYVPRIVRQSAELLADAVAHYTFISTLSVYADVSEIGIDEAAPVATLEDESTEEVTGQSYGPLKALCERAAEAAMPGRVLTVRPSLIVGPHDPTDRFTYWPWRVAQGGEVLAPGKPERRIQFIDVRDLAAWIVAMVEQQATGIYNANGPAEPLSMGELLRTCREVSGSDATFTWVSEPFLMDHQVQPWSEMPLWIRASDAAARGFFAFDCSKAIAAGLTFRPLEVTVRDTLNWARGRSPDHMWRAGLSRQREAELLRAWPRYMVGG